MRDLPHPGGGRLEGDDRARTSTLPSAGRASRASRRARSSRSSATQIAYPGIDSVMPRRSRDGRRTPTTSPTSSPSAPANADDPQCAPPPAAAAGSRRPTARRSSPRRAAAAATPSPRPVRAARSARTSTTRSPRSSSSIDRVTNGQGAMPSFSGSAHRGADPGRRRVRQRRAPAAEPLGPDSSRSRTRSAYARRGVALEIDDDVGDRDGEALAGLRDDVPLEPVRPAGRMRRDDDLVRAERAQLVLDRLQRIRSRRPRRARSTPTVASAPSEASRRSRAASQRAVDVGRPVAERRAQRRRDDEHLGVVAARPVANLVEQRAPAQVSFATTRMWRSRGRAAALPDRRLPDLRLAPQIDPDERRRARARGTRRAPPSLRRATPARATARPMRAGDERRSGTPRPR